MGVLLTPVLFFLSSPLLGSSQSEWLNTGAHLERAPEQISMGLPPSTPPTLMGGIDAHLNGQKTLAIRALNRWIESRQGPWGEERANGRFLLGWLLKEVGRYNEASTQFAIVRNSSVALSEEASWWEAWVDLRRGRHLVSARECAQYRNSWPLGVHSDECLLLMGEAYTLAGHTRTARETYELWLSENPSSLIRDRVLLRLAKLEALNGWSRAYRRLSELMLNSKDIYVAEEAHSELLSHLAQGGTIPQLSPISIAKATVQSLIRRGELDGAWELFLQSGGAPSSSIIGNWTDAERLRVMWSAQRYEAYVEGQMEAYLLTPSGETAWKIFRGYQKAGEFSLAAEWGERMMSTHSRHRRWRNADDLVAQMWQLSGNYEKARDHWREVARRRGRLGRAGRWFVAWSTFRMQDFDAAEELLAEIANSGVEHKIAASYYLGRVHQQKASYELAAQFYLSTIESDPNSWYGELARARLEELDPSSDDNSNATLQIANGSWSHGVPEDLSVETNTYIDNYSAYRAVDDQGLYPGVLAAGQLPKAQDIDWTIARQVRDQYEYPELVTESVTTPSPAFSPDSYNENPYFNSESAERIFNRFVANNKHIWPSLTVIQSLASVGIYELSGSMLESIRSEFRDSRQGGGARATLVQTAVSNNDIWRAVARHCRDHNTVARTAPRPSNGNLILDSQDPYSNWLNFPTAYISTLVENGENYDIDPLLTLSLMRQESLYRVTAESRVGANGLMQVMPITGTRIAVRLNEDLSPDELSTPATNIRYGTWYLSQLNERFEGAWPVSLAAYNAGPTNVSSWLIPWLGDIELDDFVEQIPFRETREYVKSVVGYYSVHTALYNSAAALNLPLSIDHDHQEKINF